MGDFKRTASPSQSPKGLGSYKAAAPLVLGRAQPPTKPSPHKGVGFFAGAIRIGLGRDRGGVSPSGLTRGSAPGGRASLNPIESLNASGHRTAHV